jgi:capsular polysaccharide export protein
MSDKSTIYALDFSPWKRRYVELAFADSRVQFIDSEWDAPECSTLVVWGMTRLSPEVESLCAVVRVEDGFLRSVGLGADLTRPMSWVVDRNGLYFNSQSASDLERLLLFKHFSEEDLNRASQLRKNVVTMGLSKYNVGIDRWERPQGVSEVILVPGQVESDASLAFGSPEIISNIKLLKLVRQSNPDAWIVYKPHPDVLAGMRAVGDGEDSAYLYCNEVVGDVAISHLLNRVDAVHVLTSLAGFEALLRCKKVVCYGQPFYAGWGLTHDVYPIPRRSRKLELDELVAAALIYYPIYFDRNGQQQVSVEVALTQLVDWRKSAQLLKRLILPIKRIVLRWVVGVR